MTDTITKTVFFDAKPEIVWAFLTEKDKLALWFNEPENDLTEGQPYTMNATGTDGETTVKISGRVLKADKPKTLIYTFLIGPFGDTETTVTFSLNAVAGGTRLQLTHEGIAEAAGEASLGLLMALDHGWDAHFQTFREKIAGQ